MAGSLSTAQKRSSWPEIPAPLPSPVVDNHCHLDHAIAGGRQLEVNEALDLAASVGVSRIVQVGCDVDSSRWAVEAARHYPSVVAAVAIHPNDAARLGAGLQTALEEISALAAEPGVRAVGETGLDYFRTGLAGHRAQHESFREHIKIAKRCDRTLVIHDRDAHDDILNLVDAEGAPDRVVMHCFSGDARFAQACIERGFFLSFSGTVTFKNAESLREALRITPLDRILVETDAPFLTPAPYRGRPNASYLIPHTVRQMADVLDTSVESLCRDINLNTNRAFGGPWPTRIAARI